MPATASRATAAEPIVVGRVSGLFGTRGWLKVHSYTRPYDNLLGYRPWLLRVGDAWVSHTPCEARRHHGGLIVALDGITDRDAAAALVRSDIAITRAQLGAAAAGEYYWVDLIGLTVVDTADRPLGEVRGLYETAAHDVLRVVDGGGRERLVPFVRGVYVLDVDLDARRLRVDWHPDD